MISLGSRLSLAIAGLAFLSIHGASAQTSTPLAAPVRGQLHTEARPSVRVTEQVDNGNRTKLAGHVPQVLAHSRDLGRVAPTSKAQDMVMVLRASDEQVHALHQVLDQQQDKSSPNYHQWVTPEQFGEHFGVAEDDIAQVAAWLKSQGFTVGDVAKSKRLLHFSGTTGQIEAAFQTEMHSYNTAGEMHVSNNSELTVPKALAAVVGGVTLNNYFRKAKMAPGQRLKDVQSVGVRSSTTLPMYGASSSSTHYVGPWDFATIYNTFPLLNKGITGKGSSIAVVGRSDILLSDVQSYRQLFDLPANDPIFIHAGQDNGTQAGDDGESDLDVEISGGIAPAAQVYFVIGTPTFFVDGITNSIEYIVENNTADIMSISYGSCESIEGTGGNEFNNQAFEQAAAQGISVFVAAGDNGPAQCDNSNSTYEVYGYSTGGESSTPYNVSVGGTQGYESNSAWASSTELTPPYWGLSALGYIAEVPWNESKGADKSLTTSLSDIWSGSGGISSYYIQPSWQRGSNVPTTDPAYVGGNWVTGITLTNGGGSGYTTAPAVTFSGGGCTATPAATSILSGGSVTGIAFTYFSGSTEKTGQGFGCTSAPTVVFAAAPAGGTTATATTTIGPMVNTPALVTGVPHRYTPDLSLNAASGHDATLFCSEGSCQFTTSGTTTTLVDAGLVGGTSVAAPSMAGIQALINQANGGRQGMPGYIYYALSAAQTEANCNSSSITGTNCAFQDITAGDNLICGLATCTASTTAAKIGWSAGTGYDLASGLGSVNAANLSSQWSSVVFNSSTTSLSLSQTSGIPQGTPVTISGAVAATAGSGTPTGNVAFILSQGAIGQTLDVSGDANTGAFNGPTAVATLSNGTYSATLPNLPAGSYTVTARYAGDGTYASSLSAPVAVQVNTGNAAVTISTGNINVSTCTLYTPAVLSYGSAAYFTINVGSTTGAGVPTGTLTLTVDGNTWGTIPLDPNGNGYLIAGNYATTSSCLFDYIFSQGAFLAGGTHTIGASYSGDGTFAAVSATPVSVTVSPITPTIALSSGAQTISSGFTVPLVSTFTVPSLTTAFPQQATGPTGTVTFTDTTTGATLGTATLVPTFTYTNSAASTTTYPTATYGAIASGSTTGITQTGANTVTATYSGDANYVAVTSAAATITVGTPTATTTTTLTSSANPTTVGGRPTFTATIAVSTGTAPTSGTVTFYDGTALLGTGTVGSSHTATFRPGTTTALIGGTHSITAVYGGIAAAGPSTSSALTETVTKTTGTITMSIKTSGAVGQVYALSAILPTPVSSVYTPTLGAVQFLDNGTVIGSGTPFTTTEVLGGYGIWEATYTATSLAAGNHSITATYSDANYTYTSAATVVKVYTAPVGNLDQAVAASTGSHTVSQSDSLYTSGWAADVVDGSPLANVKVLLDGVASTPTLNLSRPDLASVNASYTHAGWQLSYAASNLALGAHTVALQVTNSGGYVTTFPAVTITVVGPVTAPPVGNLDTVMGSASQTTTIPQSDALVVSGWAADPKDGSPLSNVKVILDGNTSYTPTLNLSRPDVAQSTGNSSYGNSGFYLALAGSSLSIGSHTVSVVATNSGGVSTTLGSATISVVAGTTPPTGHLDLVADNATGSTTTISQQDLIYVSGWAADYGTNGNVATVTVYADGTSLGTATLGQSRPDVAQSYNNPSWSTVGFVASPAASSLSTGSHTISVIATDHAGLTTTLGTSQITIQ